MSQFWDTFISSAAGAFFGALGAVVIAGLNSWWRRPALEIKFLGGEPFETDAITAGGEVCRFLHVQVRNAGRSTARACKVFVRKIELINQDGQRRRLNSEQLIQTNWVPREANLLSIDIPSNLDFLADIVHDFVNNGQRIVQPIFQASFSMTNNLHTHIGTFILEVVVTSDNASTVLRLIKFRFNGRPLGLFAEM